MGDCGVAPLLVIYRQPQVVCPVLDSERENQPSGNGGRLNGAQTMLDRRRSCGSELQGKFQLRASGSRSPLPPQPAGDDTRRAHANLILAQGTFFGRVPLPCRFRAIFVSIFGWIVFGAFCVSAATGLLQCALSFIAADLHGLLSKLPKARAEFVSISCHFQSNFETRKGAKDSENADLLPASCFLRQPGVERLRYDVSQN